MQTNAFAAERELHELGGLVHRAIMELPARFRSAVVLCDLEGLSYLEAAASLRVPLGTLQSRLARARKRLRDRLTVKGTAVPSSMLGVGTSGAPCIHLITSVSLPQTLLRSTCHLTMTWVIDHSAREAILLSSVGVLARKGLRAMVHSKLNGIAALVATTVILGGVIAFQHQTSADPGGNPNPQLTKGPRSKSTPQATRLPNPTFPITPARMS